MQHSLRSDIFSERPRSLAPESWEFDAGEAELAAVMTAKIGK